MLSECLVEGLLPCVVKCAGALDKADGVWSTPVQRVAQTLPERDNDWRWERVQETGLHRQKQGHLVGEPQGGVLRLVEDRADSGATG